MPPEGSTHHTRTVPFVPPRAMRSCELLSDLDLDLALLAEVVNFATRAAADGGSGQVEFSTIKAD